ncbi:MAG: ABC transporter ATP-binding protein [Coprobacillus sp.]
MENIIEVKQLCKSYVVNKKQNHVLRNIDLMVKEGEFIAVMGPSGSGKSTLLYTLSGMDYISGGEVVFDHQEISKYNDKELAQLRLHKMGFVFQQMHFLNNLNIYDNVVMPGYMANKKRNAVNDYADELFKKFKISNIAKHNIHEVSGGELQRACIVRALINEPKVLFADEPTGALNSSNAKDVMDMFRTIHEQGTTILMVTHDAKIASYAQRICYINDGKIESELLIGSVEDVSDLKSREKKVYNWLMEKGW